MQGGQKEKTNRKGQRLTGKKTWGKEGEAEGKIGGKKSKKWEVRKQRERVCWRNIKERAEDWSGACWDTRARSPPTAASTVEWKRTIIQPGTWTQRTAAAAFAAFDHTTSQALEWERTPRKRKKGASWNQKPRELIGRPAARQSEPITSLRCHWWTSGNGTASSIRSTIVACTPVGAAGLLAADWSATGHNADSDLERRSAGILTWNLTGWLQWTSK